MWLFTPSSFLSIVAPTPDSAAEKAGQLVVRARVRAHLEAAFPKAKIQTIDGRDYAFRALIGRVEVGDFLAHHVATMDYTNHKSATTNGPLHAACAKVWSVMAALQPWAPYTFRTDRERPAPAGWFGRSDEKGKKAGRLPKAERRTFATARRSLHDAVEDTLADRPSAFMLADEQDLVDAMRSR